MNIKQSYLFRVFDHKAGKMVFPEALAVFAPDVSNYGANSCMGVAFDDEDVTMATGIKDKKGVMIFEGDICKLSVSYAESNGGEEGPDIFPIEYFWGSYRFNNQVLENYIDNVTAFKNAPSCELEVIGNIFQDLDLLS